MKYRRLPGLISFLLICSCNSNQVDYDASGNFEADEVIVSAQQSGELLSFSIQEGDSLQAGLIVGQIDVTIQKLQMEQAKAMITALHAKTSSVIDQNDLVKKQLAVQQSQLDHQLKERERTEKLIKTDAATRKQLDDINALIDQLQKQIYVTSQQLKVNSSNTETLNKGILSEKEPLEKSVEQYKEQINKGQIVNPISGFVLSKYALRGEMATIGKPLYKIANTDTLSLKAFMTGDQLSKIKIGQLVEVRIDQGKNDYKKYKGYISWISDKSEFTPKTIQTKNERANLVYAIKVRVKNDGYLKIGMYGEVNWNAAAK
ncbi:MAG TPA: HlyD family efflux transporter periplasmic adaptor subunit [Puia sp.]|jgi:HlyD family secretion protein|nr:HlyD family efflux transporter periplasmic adaptor subunit [Puia sp.]